jgi:hypothetical protein
MQIRSFTDAKWEEVPHVILTGYTVWEPSVYDNELAGDDNWDNTVADYVNDDF